MGAAPSSQRRPGPQVATIGGTIQAADIAAALSAFDRSMARRPLRPGQAILLAVAHPRQQAMLAAVVPQRHPLAPAEPTLPAAAAGRLLRRIRPALLLTDVPEGPLAQAAGEAGVPVARTGAEPGAFATPAADAAAAATAYPDDLALLLETTGTSGEPKLVGLSRENLAASVAGIRETLALGPDDRTATVMPLTHVHGLVAVLHAGLGAGGTLFPIPPRDPTAFWQAVDRIRPTWLSMVPTLLQALLDAAPAERPAALAGLRFLRTSSSGLPDALRHRAEAWFGVPVVEAYGMTEACHQMASQRPGTTRPGSVGWPSPGVRIAILAADGTPVPEGAVGEVCLQGPNVMRGYLQPAEANEGAFHGGRAWFRTGDLGRLDSGGELWLTGRIKEQINRGGETLSPVEIEAALLAHPDVAEAVAFPLPHAALGEEVAAVCVPRPGRSPSAEALIAAAAGRLPFAQVPKTVFLAGSLPRLPSGKISRIGIAALYRDGAAPVPTTRPADTPGGEPAGAPPGEQAWRPRLRRHLAAVLGLEPSAVPEEASFFALGGTSLHAVQFAARLAAEEGVALPVTRLLTHPSIAALARLLAEEGARDIRTPVAAAPPAAAAFLASRHIAALHGAERLSRDPAHNRNPLLLRLADGTGFAAAEAAWRAVLASQPLLRSRLEAEATGALWLAPLGEEDWPVLERRATAADSDAIAARPEAVPEVQAFLAATSLSAPALAHASWLSAADGAAFLLLDVHGAVLDGYGRALLPRLIDAALRGLPVPAPPSDLAVICGATEEVPAAPAPTAARLHEDGTGTGREAAVLERPLPAGSWELLQHRARTAGVTPFALGLAGFALILERLAGGAMPVWAPRQRRRDAADYLAVANATALVRLVPRAAEAPDLAAAAQATMRAMFAAMAAGEDSQPEHDARACLFEIAGEAAEIEALHPALALGGGVRSVEALPERHADVDVKLVLLPPGAGAEGQARLVFAPARLGPGRAAGLLDAFVALLDRLALVPPEGIVPATVPLAPAHDRVAGWADVAPLGPDSLLGSDAADLGALFEAILGRWPQATAAAFPGGTMTFEALDRWAREVTAGLASRGAGPGTLVGFRIAEEGEARDRLLFLATQVACFRLGAALLPLGHQIPPAQAAAMVAALGIRLVVDASAARDAVPGRGPETTADRIGCHPRALLLAAPDVPGGAAALPPGTAMVFTTSGTTGRPKAIAESHATILALLRGLAALPGMPRRGAALMGTNIGFDPVLADTWIPWARGEPVVILPTERRTPATLAEASALGARLTGMSPTVAAAALRDAPGAFAGFDALLLTGEALPAPLATTLGEAAPHLAAFNLYGPTETTVWASAWRIAPGTERSVPVGHALPGYRILVADPATLAPLPPHWPGEILIGAAAPSPGYLDPVLTAERFVAVPGEAGGPFFRSGDHGWVDGDGQLRFIGRTDRQVQVRGVRIELDGVERVMAEVAGVAEAAAVVDGDGAAARLVAIVAPAAGADRGALPETVLAACRAWLPRAAVPAQVRLLDAMPRGASGKTSHAALREMLRDGRLAPAPEQAALPEPGSVAAQVAALWTELLHGNGVGAVPPILLADDLFTLGATSLDALRMAERLEAAFGVPIPNEQMFLRPTLAGQAALVAEAIAARDEAVGPAEVREGAVTIRLARGPMGAVPVDRPGPPGAILGLPGLHGDPRGLGVVAAHGLGADMVFLAAAETGGAPLDEDGRWEETAASLVAALARGAVPVPRAMIGFSMGGWLAWLVDRMRVAAGHAPIPIVNLDAGPLHQRHPHIAERLAALLPAGAGPPPRMLLVQRAQTGRFLLGHDRASEWRAAGVAPTRLDLGGIRHADVLTKGAVLAVDGAIEAFLGDPEGFQPDPAPVPLPGPSGALFRMLQDEARPSPGRVRRLLEALGPAAVDAQAAPVVLFLAMASGDAGLARDVVAQVLESFPGMRQAAFAEVALLAETGEADAALQRAEAWSGRTRAGDPAMLARAAQRLGPFRDPAKRWATAPTMSLDRPQALGFAARFCAG